ncbi:calponin homology domain-containing protein [Cladochytrium replicatum]|nr:calponin homology domain-containing protein [Cladochytrium replicatum]
MELLKEPLNIKKKADSTSGDDKLIEKLALDWLNTHLAKKEIVVENLYNSLGDGLNLIYSLEACTGESVGKYNKRSMLPVHRIDNIAVALSFLQKREVATGFLTPQDVINQDRGKILTLFNYILKKYPL